MRFRPGRVVVGDRGRRWVWALVASALVASPAGRAEPGQPLQVWVRDTMTGIGVAQATATVIDKSTGRPAAAMKAPPSGRLALEDPSPERLLDIRAEGYRAMRIPAIAADPKAAVTTVWLSRRAAR